MYTIGIISSKTCQTESIDSIDKALEKLAHLKKIFCDTHTVEKCITTEESTYEDGFTSISHKFVTLRGITYIFLSKNMTI